eukprot:TRINITY_DN2883_c0_g1_i2.p1 TRINITY_DN2883_c0_g1~~TRINITY_DN2883_c0_g1_i2.p1  ORF type:complete len:447 (+),score=77.08 TRINITY_DN2883_c0_g1_i2:192-1532(+)
MSYRSQSIGRYPAARTASPLLRSAIRSPRASSDSGKSTGSTRSKTPRSKRHAQGSVKQPVAAALLPAKLPSYDSSDKGPEDRLDQRAQCNSWFNEVRHAGFSVYDPLVKGVMIIEGVNYSLYEAAKEVPRRVEAFHESLKEDLISEVGNGVRPEDIVLRVIPGQIKTVVLHYDTNDKPRGAERHHPQLVDAEWCMKVDYVLRTRDVQRQQNVAMALYTAFTGQDGFTGSKARSAYCRTIDPSCDYRKVLFSKPKDEPAQQPQQPCAPCQPALSSPPRPPAALPIVGPSQTPVPPVQYQPAPLPHMDRVIPAPVPPHHQSQVGQGHLPSLSAHDPSMVQHIPVYTAEGPHQVHGSAFADPQRMTPVEVAEKDRQLEQLEMDIARERRALRSLQPNVVPSPGSPHTMPPSGSYGFSKPPHRKATESPAPPPHRSTALFLPSGSYIHEF